MVTCHNHHTPCGIYGIRSYLDGEKERECEKEIGEREKEDNREREREGGRKGGGVEQCNSNINHIRYSNYDL